MGQMLGAEKEHGYSWSKVPKKVGEGLIRNKEKGRQIMKGLVNCVKHIGVSLRVMEGQHTVSRTRAA